MNRPFQYRISGEPAAKPRSTAHETVPTAAEPDERDPHELSKRQALETIADAEVLQRQERELSECAYATEQFFNAGGYELIKIFGHERVLNAIRLMSAESFPQADINIPRLIRSLEPDRNKRGDLYDRMVAEANTLVRNVELFKQSLANNGRDQDLVRYERLTQPADRSHVLSVEIVAGAAENADEHYNIKSPIEKHQASTGIRKFIDTINEHPELLAKLEAEKGDLLLTIYRLDTDRNAVQAKRKEKMTRVLKMIDEILQEIAYSRDISSRYTAKGLIDQFQTFERDAHQDDRTKRILSEMKATLKDQIALLDRATDADISDASAPWQPIKTRAQNAAR